MDGVFRVQLGCGRSQRWNDLTHTFSTTDREHQETAARYRREIAEQRREQQ